MTFSRSALTDNSSLTMVVRVEAVASTVNSNPPNEARGFRWLDFVAGISSLNCTHHIPVCVCSMLKMFRAAATSSKRVLHRNLPCYLKSRLLHASASARHSVVPIGWDPIAPKLTYDVIEESAQADVFVTEDLEDLDLYDFHDDEAEEVEEEDVENMEDDERDDFLAEHGYKPKPEDATQLGHTLWKEQRRRLLYLRLIEHELPKLVGKSGYFDVVCTHSC